MASFASGRSHRFATALLAAALLPAQAAQEWEVRAAVPGPGAAWEITTALRHQIATTFSVDARVLREHEQRDEEELAWRVTLADGGERGLIAQVVCTAHHARSERVTGESEAQDLAGARFEVMLAAGEPLVFEQPDGGGEPRQVGGALAAKVAHAAREPLQGGWLAAQLTGRKLAAGQAIDVPAALARELLSEALKDADVQRTRVAGLRLVARETAVVAGRTALRVAATAVVEQPAAPDQEVPVASRTELAGELVVALDDARLLELSLAGPIRCEGSRTTDAARVEVAGTGALSWTYRARPVVE